MLLRFSAEFIQIKNQSYEATEMGFIEMNLFLLNKIVGHKSA